MEVEKKQGFLARLTEKIIGSKKAEEERPEKAEEIIEKDKITSLCGPDGCSLIVETMLAGVEPLYYWILRFLKERTGFGLGIKKVEKIQDLFTASEASSFWGSQEQRKGLQQDKVSQYMATIGKMTKDTFQIIRELRIIDERLIYYDEYNEYSKTKDENKFSGAVSLKGTWIDLVEGGTKNPASVYGLASQVGFATLPDLFFMVHPKSSEDVDKEVNKLKSKGINRKVREVLGRKLKQFLIWKEKTESELKTRKNFVLKYLRMHFNNIKLYINWVKPYLRAIKQLQSGPTYQNPDIGSAFESSQIQLELLAIGNKYTQTTPEGYEVDYEFQKYFPCIRIVFNHVTLPQMAFQKEYQRGPIHAGRTEIKIMPYVLTEDQINQYKATKDKEAFEEVEDLIPSLEGSLKALGDELTKYLKEAGELEEKKETKKETQGILSPFGSIFKGIKEIFSKEESEVSKKTSSLEKEEAENQAKTISYVIYDVFKKTHGMLAP